MKRICLITFALFISCVSLIAQLSSVDKLKIDDLFSQWNKANHPGGSIGIMKNGELVYSKAFGLASLEYEIPNKYETIYNTASVSKQFTAMAIVILQEKGLLSVDDDIRKHLPDLPDFGDVVKIRHMLHHTSGLRSLHAMLGLAGWRSDDVRTNEDLYRFMLNQKELNFKPGDEYLYCNTGFMLMVNIIEKLTEEPFPQWMQNNIFSPLGMNNTYVEDNYARVVHNNATSYTGSSSTFERAIDFWNYIGSGNMHSTPSDLLVWLENFHSPKVGWKSAFETLQTIDPLNDGSENNYAYGVAISKFKGQKKVSHSGSIGGFRAYVSTYPIEKLNIAILSNFSSSNLSQKERLIAEMLLPDNKNSSLVKSTYSIPHKTVQLSAEEMKKFEGYYWNDKENYARKIYLKNDSLRYFRSENNEETLIPITSNKFGLLENPQGMIVEFNIANEDEKQMLLKFEKDPTQRLHSFQIIKDPSILYNKYVGSYYSPELETIYQIMLKNESLICHHSRHGDMPLKLLKEDILQAPGFGLIKIQKDDKEQITGITISNGRARNVWFEKQN